MSFLKQKGFRGGPAAGAKARGAGGRLPKAGAGDPWAGSQHVALGTGGPDAFADVSVSCSYMI